MNGAHSDAGHVIYEDTEAKTVGTVTVRGKTETGFEHAITRVLNDTTLAGHMGGDQVRATDN